MWYFFTLCALMGSFAMQAWAATSSTPSSAGGTLAVHMLCAPYGGHPNEACMLVSSQGVRLSRELFDTHDDAPTDGMLRTFANVAKASGGYDWRYGFINTQGQVVVPPIYKKANVFSDGLALVATGHGWAYIDTQGRVALQLGAQWTDAHDFHHGLALVRGKGFMAGTHPMSSVGPWRVAPPWTVIDKKGSIVMGYEPAKDTGPAAGYTALEWHSSVGFTTPEIDILSDFKDGQAMFRHVSPEKARDGQGVFKSSRGASVATQFGMVDITGRIVVPLQTKYTRDDELRKADASPAKNHPPSKVLAKKFSHMDDFYEGLAWASQRMTDQQGRDAGFVNAQGQWAFKVDPQTHMVRPFRQGHAILLINEYQTGHSQTQVLVDRTGRVVANYRLLTPEIAR